LSFLIWLDDFSKAAKSMVMSRDRPGENQHDAGASRAGAPRVVTQARLGRAIRAVRRAAGMTQEEVSAVSGLHPTYISDIERGVRNPGWEAITRLADGIGVSLVEIARHYEQQ
jgi:ribosome-binding protein aMBF1 (putative translation factor)